MEFKKKEDLFQKQVERQINRKSCSKRRMKMKNKN